MKKAIVNGQEISGEAVGFELDRLVKFYMSHGMSAAEIKQNLPKLEEKALEQAIGAKLLLDEAARVNLPVTASDIDAEVQKVVKGYCKKRYEVSVGYDNITALLSDREVVANACAGRTDKLPAPRILAVNCRNTETRGDYNGNDLCHRWDRDEAMRMSLLDAEMRNNNITEKVNKRGRESLKTLATLFCE